ncbi:MAG: hypothetical protein H8E98_06365 [Bacteroidetes bacterium]|nr:hypothetical protein [Bacteroidota bacterium]
MGKIYNYIIQAQYQYEIEVEAKDIFQASKKAINELKKLMEKDDFKEERGSDISMRIWHQYP